MATLPNDDKQIQDDQKSGAGTVTTNDPNGSASLSPGGFSTSGGALGTSTAGVGNGGTGAWTNIQAYLGANQGNTSSANALNNAVGGQFNQERQNIDQSSSQAKQQAESASNPGVSQDQASKLIQDAGSQYNYGGAQSDQYNSDIGQISKALNSQYSGPTQYNYGLSSQTQDYGNALGNNQGFQAIMNALYNKSAGGTMGSGALTLQNQLDQDNPALNQARQSLMGQYGDLNTYANQTAQDTQTALKNAQSQFGVNQTALKNQLTQLGSQDKNTLDGRVNEYQNFITNLGHSHDNIVSDPMSHSTIFQADTNSMPNESNVPGLSTQRNEWNAIQDALGTGTKINQGAVWSPDQTRFNLSYSNDPADRYRSDSMNDLINSSLWGWNQSDWDRLSNFMKSGQ